MVAVCRRRPAIPMDRLFMSFCPPSRLGTIHEATDCQMFIIEKLRGFWLGHRAFSDAFLLHERRADREFDPAVHQQKGLCRCGPVRGSGQRKKKYSYLLV
jgi:hypothetical protein